MLPGTNGRPSNVAVKFLKDDMSSHERTRFMQEALSSSRLRHAHVLPLLAVCFESDPYFIVFEYMANGDLKSYLKLCAGAEALPLNTVHMLKLAKDVACGFAYIGRMKFVHRDLAARNILLSSSFCAKIGDFGWFDSESVLTTMITSD